MSYPEALKADREERIEDAANLYEHALQLSPTDLQAMINLIVLYWESSENGFYAAHHLPHEFVIRAGCRYRELLDEARRQFPGEPAVEFWRRYIASIDEGVEFSASEARAMRDDNPDYLEPELILYEGEEDGDRARSAKTLIEWCRSEGTVRAHYVRAVLEGIESRAAGARGAPR